MRQCSKHSGKITSHLYSAWYTDLVQDQSLNLQGFGCFHAK